MRVLCILAFTCLVRADSLIQQMASRLAEEANAFQHLAPQVIGRETLHQRALKPPSRFHPRVGDAAKAPPLPQWRERELVSEYGFASLGGEDQTIHEIRQVTTAEGKHVEDSKKAQEKLAKVITSSDQERKRQLLRDFQKYGLAGAVTDFGQLILLFNPRGIVRFEFLEQGVEILGDTQTFVFSYKQIDGQDPVTVFDSSHQDEAHNMRAEGQIWVRADNFLPVRISVAVSRGEGPSTVREEAIVNYQMSRFGAVLPSSTLHRELIGGSLSAENRFEYSDYHKFSAASDISFEAEPDLAVGQPRQ
jgi:hypothetical protein